MNFWKYTFTGKFKFYAATLLMSCIVAALPLYVLHQVVWVRIIFSTYGFIFLVSVAGSLYRWKQYVHKRFEGLKKWGGEKYKLN